VSADVSCRIAWSDDAEAIAAVQTAAWRERYAGGLPAGFTVDPAAWRAALDRPGDARNRVLVALERNRVVGFVVTTPAGDPDCDPVSDGEISELTVAAADRGSGHGSRLVQAAVETLQADRFTRAVTWVDATDDATRAFLSSAGWGPDGAHREVALADEAVRRQVRLHAAISPP
jgi:ribosomal protein S18 acetylase RimI-like enzyme